MVLKLDSVIIFHRFSLSQQPICVCRWPFPPVFNMNDIRTRRYSWLYRVPVLIFFHVVVVLIILFWGIANINQLALQLPLPDENLRSKGQRWPRLDKHRRGFWRHRFVFVDLSGCLELTPAVRKSTPPS